MSLVDLLGVDGLADDWEAGIFSTISVPTSITRINEPASTGTGLPLLGGIVGDVIPGGSSFERSSTASIVGGGTVSGDSPTAILGSSTAVSTPIPPAS
jgi:hypothetical protein